MRVASSRPDISSLIQRLSIEDSNERFKELQDIKTLLISLGPNINPQNLVAASEVKNLFSSLESDNNEEVELACYIINKILSTLDYIEVMHHLSSYLLNGLSHSNHQVIDLVLTQITRMLDASVAINSLIESPEIIGKVIDLLTDDDITIASSANKFLSSFGGKSYAATKLMFHSSNDSLLSRLMVVMETSDTVRFRVYELMCNVASCSEENLAICVDSGIFNRLFRELKGNDILVKVTCCTLLSDLITTTSSTHIVNYLIQAGVIVEMIEIINNSSQHPFANLYIPAVIKFFGKVCQYNGARYVCDLFSNFLPLLISFTLDNQADKSLRQVVIDTIGVVGSSLDGKLLLSEQDRIKDVMRQIARNTNDSDKLMQIASISTLACLFDHNSINGEEMARISHITNSWFNSLTTNGADNFNFVVSLCKQPYEDVKIAAFNLLTSLTTCEWGLYGMQAHPSFVEFILDRGYDMEITCKQARYDFICQLSQVPHCAEIFSNPNYIRFREYVNQGPHYVPMQVQVAVNEG